MFFNRKRPTNGRITYTQGNFFGFKTVGLLLMRANSWISKILLRDPSKFELMDKSSLTNPGKPQPIKVYFN